MPRPREATLSEYKVTWTIEIEAESATEAAAEARRIQLDPESAATHFVVCRIDGPPTDGPPIFVNLDDATEGGD